MANIEVTDLTPDTTPPATAVLLGYDTADPTAPQVYPIGDILATTWRGTYSGATAYIRGDLVAYSGATYRASQATTGNLPTNTTYWEVVAAKGDTGATGAQGPAGTNGTNGTNGAPGADGADGADGEDGASAYEVAVTNGFVGDEAAWLASLVGPEGPQGEQGPAGADGADGAPGADGADGATGATGATGPAGPTAVSADAGNAATLGADSLLYVAGIAATTHAATSKATPVDADELPLADSAASFGLKRLTWANLKATLKTYLDTLYATVGHNHSGTYEPVLGNPGTDGYVLSSTTGGTRSWVAQSGGGSAPAYINIQDQKSSGTNGGTFTTGAWQTRTLNTEVADAGNHASLSSNQITLAAGTYEFRISAPAYRVYMHQTRLQNITDGTTTWLGENEYSDVQAGNSGSGSRSIATGQFTIASSKAFEVQHRCFSTQTTNGFGAATSWGTEVYTVAEFWKLS